MSIIKMYVAASAATYAVAAIDIPANGKIRTISMGLAISDATPVTVEGAVAELSFNSTPQYATNDVRGSLCQVRAQPIFVDAARIAMAGVPFAILTPIEVPVNAGERVFLHLTPDGSVSATCVAYLFIDDGLDSNKAVRRR